MLGYDWQKKGDQIYDPRLEAKCVTEKIMTVLFRFQVQRASLTQKSGEVQQEKLLAVKKMLVPEFSRFGFKFEEYEGQQLDSQEILFNIFSRYFKFVIALEEQLLIKLQTQVESLTLAICGLFVSLQACELPEVERQIAEMKGLCE